LQQALYFWEVNDAKPFVKNLRPILEDKFGDGENYGEPHGTEYISGQSGFDIHGYTFNLKYSNSRTFAYLQSDYYRKPQTVYVVYEWAHFEKFKSDADKRMKRKAADDF